MKELIRKILKEEIVNDPLKYYGKLSKEEINWLVRRGRASYSGGELRPIIFNGVMIGGISWNLGGIDYLEFLPKYRNKGYLKHLVYDNVDENGEVKFVTASDELVKKLSNYGDIEYDKNNDIVTLTINKH